MKAVDIHPEELIERLCDGKLSGAERERLNTHLAQCAACRFEIGVRADLEREAPIASHRPQLSPAGERALAPLPMAAGSLRPRGRRRWPLVLLAAALVLCAGGATAAVLAGALPAPRWLSLASMPGGREALSRADVKPVSASKRALKAGRASAAMSPLSASSVPEAPSAGLVLEPAPPSAALAPPSAASVLEARELNVQAQTRVPALAVRERSEAPVAALPPYTAVAPAAAEPRASSLAASLFAEANQARRNGNVERAVELYQALQTQYRGSSESQLSRALLAQMLLDHGQPAAALSSFDHYLAEDSPVLNAEALVGRARALEELGEPEQACVAWRQVQSRFPGSVHARLAGARLLALGR